MDATLTKLVDKYIQDTWDVKESAKGHSRTHNFTQQEHRDAILNVITAIENATYVIAIPTP